MIDDRLACADDARAVLSIVTKGRRPATERVPSDWSPAPRIALKVPVALHLPDAALLRSSKRRVIGAKIGGIAGSILPPAANERRSSIRNWLRIVRPGITLPQAPNHAHKSIPLNFRAGGNRSVSSFDSSRHGAPILAAPAALGGY